MTFSRRDWEVLHGDGCGAEEVEGGEPDVGSEDFADPPWIEDGRVLARRAGPSLAPQFAPEVTALQRMHVLLQEGKIELQDMVHETHRLDAGGLGAPEDRLDVLGRIIEIPGPAIDFLPVA